MSKANLLAKYKNRKPQQVSFQLTPTANSDETVTLSLTARSVIVAPEGRLLVSCDFTSQELYAAAVLSNDPNMLRSFDPSIPKKLTTEVEVNGIPQQKVYTNPVRDLHLLAAVNCCFPQLFEGQPEHMWDEIARDETQIRMKGAARHYGKILNFGQLGRSKTDSIQGSLRVILR